MVGAEILKVLNGFGHDIAKESDGDSFGLFEVGQFNVEVDFGCDFGQIDSWINCIVCRLCIIIIIICMGDILCHQR